MGLWHSNKKCFQNCLKLPIQILQNIHTKMTYLLNSFEAIGKVRPNCLQGAQKALNSAWNAGRSDPKVRKTMEKLLSWHVPLMRQMLLMAEILHKLKDSLSHHFLGCISLRHLRWCRVSAMDVIAFWVAPAVSALQVCSQSFMAAHSWPGLQPDRRMPLSSVAN